MSENDELTLYEMHRDYETLMGAINKLPTNLENVKEPVNNLKNDVVNVYYLFVKILSPFYSINDQTMFDNDFNIAYSNFNTRYTDGSGKLKPERLPNFHISCSKLQHTLDVIKETTNDKEFLTNRFPKQIMVSG
jgi:hypothetical protein